MKSRNVHDRTVIQAVLIGLGLLCLSLSPTMAQAGGDPSIVGLWRVHYFAGGQPAFQSFDQWHSDGQEFEAADLGPGVLCQGTFTQTGNTVHLFHVGWNFDQNGTLTGYFQEKQTLTVGPNGEHYSGTWVVKNYDTSGNFLNEQTGTLKATRLTLH